MAEPTPLSVCPPWLVAQWGQVFARHQQGSLPHAMLFCGATGIGKQQFVRFVAESLLCRNPHPQTGACGECDSCAQLSAGAHADFRVLNPEGASATIKVDAVRELVSWMQLSAPAGRYRVALIDASDAMNRNAANSLLKTLEEPGERAVLILAASKPGVLPATIRSRCQSTVLNLSDLTSAVNWLQEQGVPDAEQQLLHSRLGPYAIVNQQTEEWQATHKLLQKAWGDLFLMRASVGKIVDSLKDLPASACLTVFASWTLAAVKQHQNIAIGSDPATTQLVSEVQTSLDNVQWFALHDRIQALYRSDSASFKTQAVLEGLFADIRNMTQVTNQG